MAIMRIWTTGYDEARLDELDHFAATISLPMFLRHDGCLGVSFGRRDGRYKAITYWRDDVAIAGLERSEDYRSTVAAIVARGFLREPQAVELLDCAGDIFGISKL